MPKFTNILRTWIDTAKPERKRYDGAFYNTTAWRKLRQLKLSRNPMCEPCKKQGKLNMVRGRKGKAVIDHHRPRRFWNELSMKIENLTTMCQSCHAKKSAKESRCKTKHDWLVMFKENE